MNTEFTKLPEEIENYRNRMNSFHWNKTVPRKTTFKWSSEIEASNLYSLGEEGAYIYLKGRNLNEQNLIYFAMQAETLGHLDMANGFWKRAYLRSKSPNKRRKKSGEEQKTDGQETSKQINNFQDLWFTLVREQRKYSCYAIFLVLPSDKEAIRYLTEYSSDLHIFSSSNALVMTIGSDGYLHTNIDGKKLSVEIKNYAKLTRVFDIDYTAIPCMIVFEGLNSPNRMPVMLKGMTAEETSEKMKAIFSIIEKSAREQKSPIVVLQKHKNDEKLRHLGKTVIGTASNIFEFTYTTIIQELTKIYAPKLDNQ